MKRFIIGFCVFLLIAVVGGAAWRLWPIRNSFYTDADAIRTPTVAVEPRDILWQPAKPLEDILNSAADDYEPRLSADGLTLFFVRGKAGHNADIYTSNRSFEGWSEPQAVVGANSEHDDLGPEPTADGQTLYFYSNREGGLGGYDLWVSRLGQGGWQAATNLGPAVNSSFNDYGPAVAPNGTLLYFASNRPQPTDAKTPNPNAWSATLREDLFYRTYDLYVATIGDSGLGDAQAINALNTPFNEGAPAVSPFGDFLYFASDRPGGHGAFDLYRSRRVRSEYRDAGNLGEAVNTQANELDPALGMGGYGLTFSSDRPSGDAEAKVTPDYNLYHTTSREVFTETEDISRPPIDWAALWRAIGPNLLWALLALLLLLFMLALFRGMQNKRLSLMMKCLLASIAAHLLLMMLFNAWEVAATLGEFTRGGKGPIRVALASTGARSAIAAQIRSGLTQPDAPALPIVQTQRAESRMEATMPAEAVQVSVARADAPTTRLQLEYSAAESRVDRSPRAPSVTAADWTPPRTQVALQARMPDAPAPSDEPEAESTPRPAVAASAQPARAAPTTSDSAGPVMVRLTAVQAATSERIETSQSLIRATNADDAPPRNTRESRASGTSLANVALPSSAATPSLRLPTDAPAPTGEFQEPSRTIAADSVVDAPRAAASATPLPQIDTVTIVPAAGSRPLPQSSVATSTSPSSSPEADAPRSTRALIRDDRLASASVPPRALSVGIMEEAALSPDPETQTSPRVAQPAMLRAESAPAAPSSPVRLVDLPMLALTSAVPARTSVADVAKSLRDTPVPQMPRGAVLASATLDSPSMSRTLSIPTPTDELPPESPYVQRFAEDRMEIVERMGGSKATEGAVQRALQWLAAHQNADGRWDGDGFDRNCGECGGETQVKADNALTGLGLLCFLGAGHTHMKDGLYRENVDRGLKWLVSRQKPDGDLRGEETMYSHGIASIALSEAYAMTGDFGLRDCVQRAINYIDKARNRTTGGWRYDPGQAGDTSVLGWQIMALKSASMAGLEVPKAALDSGKKWLDRVSDLRRPGRYSYQPGREATPGMTAEGMFVQQLLGMPPSHPKMQGSVKYIMQHLPQWDEANTYYWYYATLALFQHQGEAWEQWNAELLAQLLPNQRTDGKAAGSWDPTGEWSDVGGRVYQTALCTLMLEVYYRYLPLFSVEPQSDFDEATAEQPAIGTIRGTVTNVATGAPLGRATVRLDLASGEPVVVKTDADGTYTLAAPDVPEFFALSASHSSFAPSSANVSRDELISRTLQVDFALEPASSAILVTEAVPDVHHLGDNNFDGTINSQFQKRSEGSQFAVEFELTEDQLPPRFNKAEVQLLAKGVQRNHRIVINGQTLRKRLNEAPEDGSFGEFSAPFPTSILLSGPNSLEIIAAPSDSDIDDFEFVNVQIRLSP